MLYTWFHIFFDAKIDVLVMTLMWNCQIMSIWTTMMNFLYFLQVGFLGSKKEKLFFL
jgi:hypothetical protein